MYLIRIKQAFGAVFGLLSLTITLYALGRFVLFTSKPSQQLAKTQDLKVAVRHLLKNSSWLVVFMLQHSLQKHESVKRLWRKIGFEAIERSAYNLVSSLILLVRRSFNFSFRLSSSTRPTTRSASW